MLRDEAAAIVERRLAFLEGRRDVVLAELSFAQAKLESGVVSPHGGVFWPWFLLRRARTSIPAGTERLPLPSDWISDFEYSSIWLSDGLTKWALKRIRFDQLSGARGRPGRYEIVGSTLYLDPIPDREYAAETLYYGREEPLTANIENAWLRFSPGLLIAETVRSLAESLHMTEALRAAESDLALETRRLWASHLARIELLDRELRIGGDEYAV